MYESDELNGLVNLFILKSNQDIKDSSSDLVNNNQNFIYVNKIVNLTYILTVIL